MCFSYNSISPYSLPPRDNYIIFSSSSLIIVARDVDKQKETTVVRNEVKMKHQPSSSSSCTDEAIQTCL